MVLGDDKVFFDKLKTCFEFYESKIQANQLKNYGLATWLCFRAKPDEEKIYLNLQRCLEVAE